MSRARERSWLVGIIGAVPGHFNAGFVAQGRQLSALAAHARRMLGAVMTLAMADKFESFSHVRTLHQNVYVAGVVALLSAHGQGAAFQPTTALQYLPHDTG